MRHLCGLGDLGVWKGDGVEGGGASDGDEVDWRGWVGGDGGGVVDGEDEDEEDEEEEDEETELDHVPTKSLANITAMKHTDTP